MTAKNCACVTSVAGSEKKSMAQPDPMGRFDFWIFVAEVFLEGRAHGKFPLGQGHPAGLKDALPSF
jgi:hypothetical protein